MQGATLVGSPWDASTALARPHPSPTSPTYLPRPRLTKRQQGIYKRIGARRSGAGGLRAPPSPGGSSLPSSDGDLAVIAAAVGAGKGGGAKAAAAALDGSDDADAAGWKAPRDGGR